MPQDFAALRVAPPRAPAQPNVSSLIDALERAGIRDERILEAFRRVPREAFLPRWLASRAFEDVALPIACGQTISQPSMVALMLDELSLDPSSRLLEVGAGSGYAACVASHLAHSVHAVERHRELAQGARNTLSQLGRANVTIYHGDGAACVPRGQFDRILISAAAERFPEPLLALLPAGGRLVAPIGNQDVQVLVTCDRQQDGDLSFRESVRCRFVPLISRTVAALAPALTG